MIPPRSSITGFCAPIDLRRAAFKWNATVSARRPGERLEHTQPVVVRPGPATEDNPAVSFEIENARGLGPSHSTPGPLPYGFSPANAEWCAGEAIRGWHCL